ncbi:MAG: 1-(5-phosphoribosyl)-5-[(5-phosphoribosylamino)methylideneamino]imidazole-4-carboxamide isomerase [Clostridia bacterium]
MIILPAIDIKNGECVRLYKGAFDTTHKVAESAIKTAKTFKNAGANWLHMVDLDGALTSNGQNANLIIETIKKSGLNAEVGGGIRSLETIEFYLNAGVKRVILGSAAINNEEFTSEALKKYGDKIAIGIDALDEKVSIEGWTKKTEINYIEFAKKLESLGAKYIIFTDISRDGMLSGPNLNQLQELIKAVDINIIASGGIRYIDNISDLLSLGVYGAICGKSIYSGTLMLEEAVALCSQKE